MTRSHLPSLMQDHRVRCLCIVSLACVVFMFAIFFSPPLAAFLLIGLPCVLHR